MFACERICARVCVCACGTEIYMCVCVCVCVCACAEVCARMCECEGEGETGNFSLEFNDLIRKCLNVLIYPQDSYTLLQALILKNKIKQS